ncbi:MAG: hypothetical protein Q9191_000744 [Dirinaria sp. TL-2023a]
MSDKSAEKNQQNAEDAPVQPKGEDISATSKNASDQRDSPEKQSGTIPAKRKAKSKAKDEPSKAPRRSARGAPQTPIEPVKMVNLLLSSDSIDLCRPKDETEDLKNRGNIKTYSISAFSPFEELVCAVILSRPISHALGLRSIRTIFNDPHNFTTPKAILKAGAEGRRQALDDAKTQHRQKTAEELGLLADLANGTLGDGEDDVSLEKVRIDGQHDQEKVSKVNGDLSLHLTSPQEREILRKNVKGLGKTGLDIFGRRIQGIWPAFYPFVDQRTAAALEKLGLPADAEDLDKLLTERWEEFEIRDIDAKDDDEKKRKAFVRVLERAIGADLEGNTDAFKTKAA